MFYRARRSIHRAWFDRQCQPLLRTGPLEPNDDSLTLVSMVCHGECVMYLLAVKSFCQQLGRVPNVTVLNDGSLTVRDIAVLRSHIHNVTIVDITSVSTAGCPKNNCWERLLLINDLVDASYVVQLDCDTLTLGPIPEVASCIAGSQSFTLLGDRSYPHIEPMLRSWERLKDNQSDQVQAVCERRFNLLPESSTLSYLRGNAGFSGFAKNSIDRERIIWFSDRMRTLANDKWDDWGSEQLTSNLLIANSHDSQPLPSPQYVSYWDHPDIPYERASFIHFIGPHRFANGLYLRLAKRAIASLS